MVYYIRIDVRRAMKKVFKILALFLSIVFLIVLGFLTHAGLFQPVVAVEKEMGPFTMVYQEHSGPYYQVKDDMDEVYYGLERMGVITYRGIGLYYDDPKQVESADLRSEVGSILEEKDWSEIERIESEFAVKTIPAQTAVVAELPIRNPLSYMVGPQKVYRQVNRIWQEQGYAEPEYSLEIYDEANRKITYITPIPGAESPGEAAADLLEPNQEAMAAEAENASETAEQQEDDQVQTNEAAEIETAVRASIVEKRGSDPADLEISVERVQGDYAQGLVRERSSMVGGAGWFAAKVDGSWELVWDGNGTVMCDDLVSYPDFPSSLIPDCYDSNSGQMVER